MDKNEKKFHEHSYPHSASLKGEWKENYDVSTKGGYQDLLGAFYYVRSTGRIPKVGDWLTRTVAAAGDQFTVNRGGSFARAALGALMRAAREVKEHGTFGYAKDAMPASEAASYMLDATR